MTWIVTGASGLLGPYLVEAISKVYQVSTKRVELTDEATVRTHFKLWAQSVVVHAAAYTDVDGCEKNPAKAAKINQDATKWIAQSIPKETKLVYISTDMVYPDTPGPHKEGETWWEDHGDKNKPRNQYAISKQFGEIEAMGAHTNTLVLRTNFFGPSKNNRRSFSDWVLEEEPSGKEFYDDILFSPLHMRTLAELVVECCERNIVGLFNAGSRDGFDKHRFAERLSGTKKRIGKSQFVVPRPHDMRMDVSRLERVLGRKMPTLYDEIWKMKQ